ncbi:MAG: tetratricopeptide repeat protein [Candidatus Sericytochromatia bacterium]
MRRPLLPLWVVPVDLLVGVGLAFGWPFGWLLALHGVAAVATGCLWGFALRGEKLVSCRAAVVALAFPVVGSLALWLVFPPEDEGSGTLADDYRAFIAYTTPASALQAVGDVDEALRRELSVRPLVEVLRHGDLAAKQGAASALAAFESAEAVRQLRLALVDPDDETRLFASLGLVQMEEAFLERLRAVRDRRALEPHSPDAALTLAHEARRYAESGLPAGGLARAFWEEAEAAALDATSSPTVAVEAWLVAAGARVALGRFDDARAAGERALAIAPNHPAALRVLMEAHFAAGELEALAPLARALELAPADTTPAPDPDTMQIARYWATGPAPEARP